MSKRINVNPDHYKTAGRERPGGGVLHDRLRRVHALEQALVESWQATRRPELPPPPPRKPVAKGKKTAAQKRATRPARKPARTTAANARSKKPASRAKRAKRVS
jgi:hypothetical protein